MSANFSLPTLTLGSLLSLAVSAAAASHAAIVTQYTFATDLAATTVDTNLTSASTFGGLSAGNTQATYSSGTGIAEDGSSYTSSNPLNNVATWTGPGGRVFARSFPNGPSNSFVYYYGFSVTVDTGYSLNIDNLTFDMGFRTTSASAIKVEYSTSSDFSSGVVLLGDGAGFVASPQTGLGYGAGDTFGVTLASGTNFSWNRLTNSENTTGDEALTDTVYFRIWARGGGSANNTTSGANLWIDNVTLNGSVNVLNVIPEPASLSLLSLGALLLLRRKR